MTYPSQELDTVNLRFPDGLRDRLKEAGKGNNRSMNAEIVARLKASFDAPSAIDAEVSKLLAEHINRKVAERLSEIARTLGAAS
ncbi:Arc family DNA-binding protein [Mesorhizobium sp.]|uniref:Arc family DNA-binding protein n=1 Tax=Mesorhizobium sp. TaxID=1871066 RepID=UPI0025ECD2C0|nr:Arc family DNA-binding protein [Mesorhizobium sp.]